MKIYLKEKSDITKFNLSEEISGSYLFTHNLYENNREISISIEEVNKEWVLKSNGNTNIVNKDFYMDQIILKDYMAIPIYVKGLDYYLYIYTFPSLENTLISYKVENISEIKIGSEDSNNIVYKLNGVLPEHAIIIKENTFWFISPINSNGNQSDVFLNNRKISEKTRLLIGDTIFINGLKIIWMGLFFKITNFSELYKINNITSYTESNPIDTNEYLETQDEIPEDIGNKNYFVHTPRIRNINTIEEIKLDAPPQRQDLDEGMPFILSIASSMTMMTMTIYNGYNIYANIKSGEATLSSQVAGIISCIAMISATLLVPIITHLWQKQHRKSKEAERQQKYKEYLNNKEIELQHLIQKQLQITLENNPGLEECKEIIVTKNQLLWNRKIEDEDFLKIRAGIGTKPSEIEISTPEEKFSLYDDNLLNSVIEMKEKYKTITNIPILLDLKSNIVSALIITGMYKQKLIDAFMLQLLTFHSPLDLKLIIVTNNRNKNEWEYVKYLPHNWDDERTIRFFSSEQEDLKKIIKYIEEEYNKRVEEKKSNQAESEEGNLVNKDAYKLYEPYYLIITDDFIQLRDVECIENILSKKTNYGFSIMIIDENMKQLPKECQSFMCISDLDGGLFKGEIKEEEIEKFKAEYDENINMRKISMKIGEIAVQSKNAELSLPTVLPFLEMYNVGKIEQLNVKNRWKKSEPMKSLSTAIGVHKNGEIFNLDLHEKFEGPHGLIAGTTGSGKSEFIITYVLSLAVNYDPREVQFILIDYKGGGLAGAFENREKGIAIPHLAGTITNLDTAEMNRTLVSIQSELKRRQAKFNEVREALGESTMEIYKYQKLYRDGVITEPMSHLFIICDEFAELKAQQPDFMENLISASRIGRSLGIHLILATQKPSGVVNDQIWSNSKFKVCLKVASKADSQEMLKRPEAASIKETGRFYLQVGYDEYFDIGQSAWSGAKYTPVERIIKKEDDSIIFINNSGNTTKSVNNILKNSNNNTVDNGDQLTNIVKYLQKIAIEDKIPTSTLWLPSLRKEIMLDSLFEKYKVSKDIQDIVIGEYDAPSKQMQGIQTINFLTEGNLLIYGVPGAGKDGIISTIIYDLSARFTPEDINIYITDFGAETLKGFKNFPHVGDVCTIEEKQKIDCLIKMLYKEFERRKKEYSDLGGNYIEYSKLSNKKDPIVLTCINNIEIFFETYPKNQESFDQLFRDGFKYGIVFVVSTTATNIPRSRVAQSFSNKICLKMANDGSYRDILGSPKGLIPVDTYGRGIISKDGEETYEFQTCQFVDKENRTKFLIDEAEKLSNKYQTQKAKPIPVLPEIVTVEDVKYELKNIGCIPIGIERKSLEVYVYNFMETKINIIAGISIKNHIYFVYALIKQMLMLKNVQVNIIDTLGIYRGDYEGVKLYEDNIEQAFVDAYSNIQNDDKLEKVNVYICLGISEFKSRVSKKYDKYFEILFSNVNNCKNNTFLLLDDYNGFKHIQSELWYKKNIQNTYGIWLGEDIGTQVTIGVMSLSLEDKQLQFPCIGYPIYNGNHMIIKYVVDGVDKKDGE
jgi:DNA segregation ATPase FtsK/SpoIIIE, S-DNA-T family